MTLELNRIYNMDCLAEMAKMPENSIDAIVTDPPYGLEFMGKEWDKLEPARNKQRWKGKPRKLIGDGSGKGGNFGERFGEMPQYRPNRNKKCQICGHYKFSGTPCKCETPDWDDRKDEHSSAMQDWHYKWAVEALRVVKPGGHALVFGGTRTHHRLMVALEDAGWEIRDCLMWVYGSGFPKSHDVSKAIDREAGVKRKVIGTVNGMGKQNPEWNGTAQGRAENSLKPVYELTEPATEAAKQWNGWGTALKPAWEPIILCRKPLEGTVAENVQKWGTGAINIDGCRVAYQSKADYDNLINNYKGGLERATPETKESWNLHEGGWKLGKGITLPDELKGRFPANFIHDGSEEVLALFPESKCGEFNGNRNLPRSKNTYNHFATKNEIGHPASSGSAARFFYCAKASKSERNLGLPEGTTNKHPTVKPLALIKYLIKLISVENAVVLDPFMGSGTTGVACMRLGRKFVGYELDTDSFITAETRLNKAR